MEDKRLGSLPVRGSLRPFYIFSLIIAALVVFVSLSGIVLQESVYSSGELLQAFMPNDIVNLIIGIPVLLGSMCSARRGGLTGLLCWPGALLFMAYNYIAYVVAIPVNWLFLFHLTITAASIYTLIGLISRIDGEAVKQKLEGAVPERLAGGMLAGLGLMFVLRVIGVVIIALQDGVIPSEAEFAANISDFLTSPAWIIGGILLWRSKELGYVTGLGLLFQGSMLFIALIIYLILQPILTDAPFPVVDIIVIFVMGMLCFIPFALFLRGMDRKRG